MSFARTGATSRDKAKDSALNCISILWLGAAAVQSLGIRRYTAEGLERQFQSGS